MNQTYNKDDFTADQWAQIQEGISQGLDVSSYANPEFLAIQMYEIRNGLMLQLPVEKYASTKYDWFQMEEIRKGLQKGLPIEKFADPAIPYAIMRQIRKGLKQGIDLSAAGTTFSAGVLRQLRKAMSDGVNLVEYIRAGYDEEQLDEIRIALLVELEIAPYLSPDYRGASIREIRLGLEHCVDVSLYARSVYSWQQMRELRLGLEGRLDVHTYDNPLYSWQQMQELRLGLEAGLDTSGYQSLMYTAKEMCKKRLLLLEGKPTAPMHPGKMSDGELIVLISEDEMSAMVILQKEPSSYSREDIFHALEKNGVKHGIDEKAIDALLSGACADQSSSVAHGTTPEKGADGWYEYFFNVDHKKKPKLLEDGSVDYLNVEWFEIVHKGQKVAYYHEAETGAPGMTVTGIAISGMKGTEQRLLSGKGFVLLPDQKTYIAELDGKIELKKEHLEISSLLIVDSVTMATGNLDFNGSIYIRGGVGAGIRVHAEGDILIDGFVEAAEIEAGGDIYIRKGSNGSGQGTIRAGGDVSGNFFEATRVYAADNIRANYCLNCDLHADGKIQMAGRSGVLAGGTSYAAAGVAAQNLGNSAGIVTSVKTGRREGFMNEELVLLEKEKGVEQELILLKNGYYNLQKNYSVEERNANPMYLKLENAIYTKELQMEHLYRKKQKMEEEKARFRHAKVSVQGALFEGVKIDINGVLWKAKRMQRVTLKEKDNRISVYR